MRSDLPAHSHNRAAILREVASFYALAFLISWAAWLPPLLRQWRVPGFSSVLWLGVTAIGAAGPAIAAWAVDRQFLASLRHSVRWQWLLLSVLLPAVLLVGTNVLTRVIQPGSLSLVPVRGSAILWLVAMAMGANIWEEIGWRAYALRRLQQIMSPWMAAAVVGVLWAAWHLPLFVSAWSGMQGIPFGWWALRVVGTSVIMTWLWNRTHGTIWAVTRVPRRLERLGSLPGSGLTQLGGRRSLDSRSRITLADQLSPRPQATQRAGKHHPAVFLSCRV